MPVHAASQRLTYITHSRTIHTINDNNWEKISTNLYRIQHLNTFSAQYGEQIVKKLYSIYNISIECKCVSQVRNRFYTKRKTQQ